MLERASATVATATFVRPRTVVSDTVVAPVPDRRSPSSRASSITKPESWAEPAPVAWTPISASATVTPLIAGDPDPVSATPTPAPSTRPPETEGAASPSTRRPTSNPEVAESTAVPAACSTQHNPQPASPDTRARVIVGCSAPATTIPPPSLSDAVTSVSSRASPVGVSGPDEGRSTSPKPPTPSAATPPLSRTRSNR